MVELVLPNIYKIEVPLPKNPLKEINSYVIKSNKRHLIIDTGMNRAECRVAILAGLAEIKVDLANTDFFVTHYHIDHAGLVSSLIRPGAKAFASEDDGAVVNIAGGANPKHYWLQLQNCAAKYGFPANLLEKAVMKHPGYLYRPAHLLKITTVSEGDIIRAGEYNFQCLLTPGHTGGHVCLYEKEKKILISGDHILGNITPNISQFYEDEDALAEYFKSLDKIARLEIDIVLPAHHSIFTGCKERISQLREHHLGRIEEVWQIVSEHQSINAYQAAALMTWDMRGTWDNFPVQQKWFAFGEAIAHLEFLHRQGRLTRKLGVNGVYNWSTN